MNISYTEFYESANAVVKALNEVQHDDEACSHHLSLSRWEVRKSRTDDGIRYLYHPPINVVVSNTKIVKHGARDAEGEEILDITELEDDTILQDVDAYCGSKSTADAIATADTGKQTTTTTTTYLQWNFSVVYSDTYQVPVLYFTVQDCVTGNTCGRQKVLDCLLRKQRHEEGEEEEEAHDTWEFISQEQHPILNIPSYFLHPCQSSQRLHLLLQAQRDICDDSNNEYKKGSKLAIVWIWMAMILPAVNHPIPPTYFQMIQDKIKRYNTNIKR
jgi:ubiquitin-like-conjugating enzyme ATG10